MPIEDFYLAEALSHLLSQLLTLILSNNQHVVANMTHRHMIQAGVRAIASVNEFKALGELQKDQIRLVIFNEFENICQGVFRTDPHNIRLILYENGQFTCFDSEKSQFKS